jgi:hypothetical protein
MNARATALGAGLVVLVTLAATTEERLFGVIPDGQQMLSTAVDVRAAQL